MKRRQKSDFTFGVRFNSEDLILFFFWRISLFSWNYSIDVNFVLHRVARVLRLENFSLFACCFVGVCCILFRTDVAKEVRKTAIFELSLWNRHGDNPPSILDYSSIFFTIWMVEIWVIVSLFLIRVLYYTNISHYEFCLDYHCESIDKMRNVSLWSRK